MALMPSRVKYRKHQRGKTKGRASRGNTVAFGEYGLQALEGGTVSGQQLEAGRVAAMHYLRDEGKLTMRIFPDKSMTATPAETRMGKGKGEPEKWVADVKAGRIIFELGGVPRELAVETLARIAHRMPVKCRMVERGYDS